MTGSITEARTSLDQLLKQIADKSEESVLLEDDVKEPDRLQAGSQPSTPRKRPSSSGNRTPRKRIKREITPQEIETQATVPTQPTYIHKLFDRSVDFAKFNKDTSLYVLARAWMKNTPHAVETESPSESSSTSDFNQNSDAVRSLPPPVDENVPCSVIPEPLFQTQTATLNLENSLVNPPRTADLLNQHMTRWKAIRKSWKGASHKNQRRYMSSIQLIRKLFNQQL